MVGVAVTRRRRVRGTAALLLVALALGACRPQASESNAGSDDGSPTTVAGEPTEATLAPGVTEDTIKIGMFAPLSGPAAVYGKGMRSMVALYEEINEQGGVNGRRLELVVEDSECDPTTVNLVVTKLIDSEGAFLLHGGMCSNAVINALPEIEQSGIPFVVMAAAAAEIIDPPIRNVFAPWVSQPANTIAIAEYVVSFLSETGGSRVALVSQRDDWGTGWISFLQRDLEAIAQREGVTYELVADEELREDLTDATPQVRRVLESDADLSVVFALPQPMSVYLRDADAQGLDIPILTGNAVEPAEQLDRVGNRAAVDNLTTTYCFGEPLDSAAMEPYRRRLADSSPNDEFDGIAVSGVVGAEVIIEVLTALGDDLTWDSFIEGMEAIEAYESPLSPTPVSFTPFGEGDPSSRSGADRCILSALDPEGADESDVVVFEPVYQGSAAAAVEQ